MKQAITTYHVLEQYGPRSQAWRQVNRDDCPEAFMLAYDGHLSEALRMADTEYITRHGDMHGVRFRTRTQTITLTTNGPESDFNDYPLDT